MITSIIIALLHFIFSPYRVISHIYDLKLGEIAEKDINAPFDFNVYKTKETLDAEQTAAEAKVQPIYKVSENLKFNAQKNLDFVFQHFVLNDGSDSQKTNRKLKQNGYELSLENTKLLMNDNRRVRIYNFLSENITKIFTIGIYPDNYRFQEIKISKSNRIIDYELNRLYSLEEAKNKLAEEKKNLEKWNSSKLPFPFLPKVHDGAFRHPGHKNDQPPARRLPAGTPPPAAADGNGCSPSSWVGGR